MRISPLLGFAATLLTCVQPAIAQEMPPGYRLPTQKELADPDRAASPTRFARAVADFNGDGVEDEAVLLKSTKYSGQALFVRLSDGNKGYRWVQLDSIDWGPKYPNVDLSMAIEVLKPGVHEYYCFDGEKACDGDEPAKKKKLTLTKPGLSYYKFESSGSFFLWDAKTNKFLRAWNSE
jgi:hypothetical protein